MEIRLHNCFLAHLDPEATLGFYRDVLGFEVRNDVGYNGMRWITVGPPEQPDVSLVLAPPAVDPAISEDERRVISEMMANGTYGHIILATPELDAVYAHLVDRGVTVVQEPTQQPYGVRDCVVRDPAGNLVRFNEVPATH